MINPLFGDEKENTQTQLGRSVLEAVKADQLDRVQELVRTATESLTYKDERGRTALHWACVAASRQEMVVLLLKHGVEIDDRDARGRTPLHYAVEHSNNKVGELLLRNGAQANATFDCGVSALHLAARNGNTAMVSMLLDYHADVHLKSDGDRGRSAVMSAVAGGHLATVHLLLQAHADPSDRFPVYDPEQGRSLLHTAIMRGYRDITEELLIAGADMDAKDLNNKTPLDLTDDPNTPLRDITSLVLLSHSANRVIAAGGLVETWSQIFYLVGCTSLWYVNWLTDLLLAPMLLRRGKSWWCAAVLVLSLSPHLAHGSLQWARGFKGSSIRSLGLVELAWSARESLRTKRKTPVFMALHLLQLGMESIPMAIIQVYMLLTFWTEWKLDIVDNELRVVPIFVVSTIVSLVSIMQTAAMLTLENDDSAWKGKLQGTFGMVMALVYFTGDVSLHIGVFAMFAYTHHQWVCLVILMNFFVFLALLYRALGSNSQAMLRALLLAPLLTFVDFPLRPANVTGKSTEWLLHRTLVLSTCTSIVLVVLAVFNPQHYLPDFRVREVYERESVSASSGRGHGTVAVFLMLVFLVAFSVKIAAMGRIGMLLDKFRAASRTTKQWSQYEKSESGRLEMQPNPMYSPNVNGQQRPSDASSRLRHITIGVHHLPSPRTELDGESVVNTR